MDNKQENRFSMYLTVRDYLLPFGAITTALPNYSAYFTSFQGNITQIQTQRDIQEGDKTGVATNKSQLKEILVATALDVSNKLVSFCKNTNNAALEAEIKFSETSLRKSPDTILKDRAQLLYNRANTNVAALAVYNITAVTQTAFLAAITNYQASIPKPRLTLNERKQATDLIRKNFDLANSVLVKIDSVLSIVAQTQSSFYNGYVNARKVIELGGGSLALKGFVVDENKQAISKAKIEIKTASDTNTLAKVAGVEKLVASKLSSVKGGFQIKGMKDGNYTATITKPGYTPETVNFSIVGGEMTKLNVVLVKE